MKYIISGINLKTTDKPYVTNGTEIGKKMVNYEQYTQVQTVLDESDFDDTMADTKDKRYRMYVFVERHLSPLDKGIQSAHAVVEYANMYGDEDFYKEWAVIDKALILLNGGTCTNLWEIVKRLRDNRVNYATFQEVELSNSLTAVALIVDERVFDNKEYPDFETWRNNKYSVLKVNLAHTIMSLQECSYDPNDYTRKCHLKEYKEYIGGEQNYFLKELLRNYHLAK